MNNDIQKKTSCPKSMYFKKSIFKNQKKVVKDKKITKKANTFTRYDVNENTP